MDKKRPNTLTVASILAFILYPLQAILYAVLNLLGVSSTGWVQVALLFVIAGIAVAAWVGIRKMKLWGAILFTAMVAVIQIPAAALGYASPVGILLSLLFVAIIWFGYYTDIDARIPNYMVPVLAVFTAIILGGIVIAGVGGNPFQAYIGLVQGAFGTKKAISETAVWATPYIFAGLAVAVAFKGGLFNIGAEGQLALGAVVSALIGYALPEWLGLELPMIIHLPLAVALGALAGALWAAIPGFLKAYTGGHEVINTIMMNYIALNLTSFLLNGPMRDHSATNLSARTPEIALGARIAPLFEGFRVHWGFILALLVAFLIWFLLQKTTFGFELRMVGANPDAAKYAGINVKRAIVLTMALSGMLAGLAGAIEVTALNYRHELGFSQGYGFDAIAIALLGKSNPFGVVIAAILFGAMRNGATRMQFLTMIPVDVISIIQALILLFVAADAIIRYIYRIRSRGERVVLTRGWGG